jgi:hypothetical protein
MIELGAVTTALASVKTASEILKIIRGAGQELESAEYKLKLAELTETLADLRIFMSELRESLLEKDAEISSLKDALQLKATVIRHSDVYYEKDEEGKAIGSAFCPRCWEVEFKLIHLVRNARPTNKSRCPKCENLFMLKPDIGQNKKEDWVE